MNDGLVRCILWLVVVSPFVYVTIVGGKDPPPYHESVVAVVLLAFSAGATASLAFRAVRAVRRWRVEARVRKGQCPCCGYDLRASPDLCPECGTPKMAKEGNRPKNGPELSD